MVRRDDDGDLIPVEDGKPASRCDDPAGESPVPVGGDAPGSRLPASREILASEAERREPVSRKRSGRQARGPQHEVKPADSTDSQSEGRAAHVTAKATPAKRDPVRDDGLGGVWGAARVQGPSRNTREPSAQPPSR